MANKTNESKNYKETVTFQSGTMTAREMLRLKDSSNAMKLSAFMKELDTKKATVHVDNWVILHVENDFSDDKEYNIIVLDTDNGKLSTSSNSFITRFQSITGELEACGEPINDFDLDILIRPSKKYDSGFISCALS